MDNHKQNERKSERVAGLSNRLQQLESQLGRLTDLLIEQAATRKRRRRQLTLRVLLVSFVGFAVVFAWFGRVYHGSLRQANAVDQLISQNAFVLYEPRDSALISMLPGDAADPPRFLRKSLGVDFFRAVVNVSTKNSANVEKDKKKIISALASIPELQRLRLVNLSLRTGDLTSLGDLRELQSIDLSRTGLDAGAMPWLEETELRWFDASHTRVSDRAVYDLSRCRDLQHLNLERTAVTDKGLTYLYSMQQLRYLNLKRSPVTLAAVEKLSKALPTCVIEWEPLQFLASGRVNVAAARNGYIQLGRQKPQDPRASHRAIPPLDQAPARMVPTANGWTQQQYRNGFILDVF